MSLYIDGHNDTSFINAPHGQQLVITCQAKGANPAVNLTWMSNGSEPWSLRNITTTVKRDGMTFESKTILQTTLLEHEGQIQCKSNAGKTFTERKVGFTYRTFGKFCY